MRDDWREQRNQIIGLGENSFKKSYYPELQEKLSELETSYNNLKSIFDNVGDGIVLHDVNGNIYFNNRQAARIINATENLAKDHEINVLDLFPDKQEKFKMLDIWKEAMNGVSRVVSTSFKPLGSDMMIYVQVSMNKTLWYGKPLVVAVIRDFTERANFENQLVKAKDKAEEGERLMTAFLQNISHEIRTPLNAIMGFSGLLVENELTSDKRKDFVSIILKSSSQLLNIVNDILTISSIETRQVKLSLTNANLNQLIDSIYAYFKSEADSNGLELKFNKGLSDNRADVYTDIMKLHQILFNLISNALKFTKTGSITFGYDVNEGETGEYLSFFVKDTGIGIEKERHQLIFEKFRKIDNKTGVLNRGIGLGLSIAKAFADIMGGRIWVQSVPGEGSVFYLEIPYKPIYEGITMENKNVENTSVILVAEDEEYNYLYLDELLNKLGLKHIQAKDGKEAIDICLENKNVNLVLMDIKMPVIDGYTAAQKIKEFSPKIPIIAQSAYALEHEREKFRDVFDDYLAKPINKEIFLMTLRKFIEIKNGY